MFRAWVVGTVLATCACGGGIEARKPCHRSYFKTQLVHDACARGGQTEARAAMTAFAKDHTVPSCLKCHLTLTPYFDLRPEGFNNYLAFGGHPFAGPSPSPPPPPPPVPPTDVDPTR